MVGVAGKGRRGEVIWNLEDHIDELELIHVTAWIARKVQRVISPVG